MKILDNIDVSNKNVLVRLDIDVPLSGERSKKSGVRIVDDTRLSHTLSTIEYLLQHGARVTILGHLGRPGGKPVTGLSVRPIRDWYEARFPDATLAVAENLRFEAGEGANDSEFAKDIVRRFKAQSYVFDAFASSHDRHASIVQIPRLLPTMVGFRFQAELDHLQIVLSNPKRPLVFVIGGAKSETKIPLVEKLLETADAIFAGGTLPLKLNPKVGKLIVAKLAPDGLDITEDSAKLFAEKIRSAGTVVWNGPLGAFEKSAKSQISNLKSQSEFKNTPARGTYMAAQAMQETKAYTVVGGGDTEAALKMFGLGSGIDWVSSGGGAMLHYLAYRTLPFLEAIQEH